MIHRDIIFELKSPIVGWFICAKMPYFPEGFNRWENVRFEGHFNNLKTSTVICQKEVTTFQKFSQGLNLKCSDQFSPKNIELKILHHLELTFTKKPLNFGPNEFWDVVTMSISVLLFQNILKWRYFFLANDGRRVHNENIVTLLDLAVYFPDSL